MALHAANVLWATFPPRVHSGTTERSLRQPAHPQSATPFRPLTARSGQRIRGIPVEKLAETVPIFQNAISLETPNCPHLRPVSRNRCLRTTITRIHGP